MDGMRESEKYGFLSKERDWGRGWQQGELGLGGCGVEIGEFFGRVLVPEESRWDADMLLQHPFIRKHELAV